MPQAIIHRTGIRLCMVYGLFTGSVRQAIADQPAQACPDQHVDGNRDAIDREVEMPLGGKQQEARRPTEFAEVLHDSGLKIQRQAYERQYQANYGKSLCPARRGLCSLCLMFHSGLLVPPLRFRKKFGSRLPRVQVARGNGIYLPVPRTVVATRRAVHGTRKSHHDPRLP